eukprot:scaffold291406_cov19-Tisochrysis_lutea.AAC.2
MGAMDSELAPAWPLDCGAQGSSSLLGACMCADGQASRSLPSLTTRAPLPFQIRPEDGPQRCALA